MSAVSAHILVIGRGGREHALAWALARSARVDRVSVAPGNGGTAMMGGKVTNIALQEEDFAGLAGYAEREHVGLIVVGPEAPLAAGAADHFSAAGFACFGPTQAAARLESSKAFAKDFMQRHDIPTARHAVFRDLGAGLQHLRGLDHPIVLKASGLAAGKGVILPATAAEAEAALELMLNGRLFQSAGEEVVIEERLSGPELSVLAFCDGTNFCVMPAAQDHKRVFDGDQGPNTGGMGAYAPAPVASAAVMAAAHDIIRRTLAGMTAEGTPFIGVLYVGLMLTADGPKVIEFNCRFGDPETQVILPLLETDLAAVLLACAQRRLPQVPALWRSGAALTIVAASGGYPGAYSKGLPISGLAEVAALPDTLVFHAGTRLGGAGQVLTDGGRVLTVTGCGRTLAEAYERATAGIGHIAFDGMHHRRDIGAQAL